MSKEENISDIEKKVKSVQITGKVSQETSDMFKELMHSGDYATFGQFMDTLLETYLRPIKISRDYESEIKTLNEKIKDLEGQLNEKSETLNIAAENAQKNFDQFEEWRGKYADLQAKYEELSKANMQQAGRLEELDGLQHKMDGHILVPVNDLDMRCLEYLASREAKLRKREDITPAVFFQYAVREMLIKGNKFAIDSVPDSVIAKFKQDINNGK